MKHLSLEATAAGVETHSSLAACLPLSLIVLLLFFANQLPPYAAFTYLFPVPDRADGSD